MTLHTAKGLEYDAVFLTGVEEDLLPHRMSASEPGGLAEERRLFYVGHHARASKRLYLSLAMTRVAVRRHQRRDAEPLPAGDPGRAHRLEAVARRWRPRGGGTQPRALNARPSHGSSTAASSVRSTQLPPAPPRVKTEWTNAVTNKVRDNGDLTLAVGDRIRHTDFGEGRVTAVTGEGAKSIAEVQFDTAGRKRLLIKIAPIEKL